MSRFELRLSSVDALLTDTVMLNEKLNLLINRTNLKNAKEVVEVANGISMQLSMLSGAIPLDLKARWIDLEEYEILVSKLENVKSILAMLGWEE